MAASGDAILLLQSIDTTLKAMLSLMQRRESKSSAKEKAVAGDRDLDGKYGDPDVKFNPRDWIGVSCVGRRFSECPPDFLDMIAETFDYFAQKAEDTNELYNGKSVAPYKRKDAARARGWAKRMRSGAHKPPQTTDTADHEWATPSGW